MSKTDFALPSGLSQLASDEYKRLARELQKRSGIVPPLDGNNLLAYCKAWETFTIADKAVERDGIIITTKHGNIIPNPALGIRNTSAKLMRSLGNDLGLSPRSRGSVSSSSRKPSPPPGVDDESEN